MARRDIEAGKAFVRLSVRGRGPFDRAFSLAGRTLVSFGSMATRAAVAAAGAGAAITAGLTASVVRFAAVGDKIDKMAIRTGVSANALSELGFAAEQSGSNLDQLGQAVFRMGRRIANAATKTGPAARAMKELGLNAREVSQLPMEQQFNTIVDALQGVENQFRANQLGFELFGNNFRQLQPLIAQGTDGIAKLRDRARELGRTITPEQAASAAAVTDAMNEARSALDGIVVDIGSKVAPHAVRLLNIFTNMATPISGFARLALSSFKDMFVSLKDLTGGLGFFVDALGGVGEAILGGQFLSAWKLATEIMGATWDVFTGSVVTVFADMMSRVIDLVERGAQKMVKPLTAAAGTVLGLGAIIDGILKGKSSGEIKSDISSVGNLLKPGATLLSGSITAGAASARSVADSLASSGAARSGAARARLRESTGGGFGRFLEAFGVFGSGSGGSGPSSPGDTAGLSPGRIQSATATFSAAAAVAAGGGGAAKDIADIRRTARLELKEMKLTRRILERKLGLR